MNKPIKILLLAFFVFLFLVGESWAQYKPGNIFSSARMGDIEAVKEYIDDGAGQGTLDNALGAAVVGNQIKIMKLLIKNGADVNHISSFDTPILINAIMYGMVEAAELLIKSGANIHVEGYNRIEKNLNISWNWTPLMCAARKGSFDLVKLLLKKGADPNKKGWSVSPWELETSADIAAYSGHLDILKYLRKKGSEVNSHTLYKAVRGGHLDVAEYLFSKETQKDSLGPLDKTLLMEACWWGHVHIVQFLLEKGVAVNQKGQKDYTALFETITSDNNSLPKKHEIVKLLVENGADVDLRDVYGKKLMKYAEDLGDEKILKLLKSHSVFRERKDQK